MAPKEEELAPSGTSTSGKPILFFSAFAFASPSSESCVLYLRDSDSPPAEVVCVPTFRIQRQQVSHFYASCQLIREIAIVGLRRGRLRYQRRNMFSGMCHFLPGPRGSIAENQYLTSVCSHCNACKVVGGCEYTLNQIVPKDNLKITKGDLKSYTYKGDSGLPLFPNILSYSIETVSHADSVYQVTPWTAFSAQPAAPTSITTSTSWATTWSSALRSSRVQRSGASQRRRSMGSRNGAGSHRLRTTSSIPRHHRELCR